MVLAILVALSVSVWDEVVSLKPYLHIKRNRRLTLVFDLSSMGGPARDLNPGRHSLQSWGSKATLSDASRHQSD